MAPWNKSCTFVSIKNWKKKKKKNHHDLRSYADTSDRCCYGVSIKSPVDDVANFTQFKLLDRDMAHACLYTVYQRCLIPIDLWYIHNHTMIDVGMLMLGEYVILITNLRNGRRTNGYSAGILAMTLFACY